MLTKIIIGYLVVINITGFALMGIDKQKAVNGQWRIPEKAFFIVSVFGGSVGSLCGMYLFHHKTKHWYFVMFIPLIMVIQIALAIYLLATRVI